MRWAGHVAGTEAHGSGAENLLDLSVDGSILYYTHRN